MKKHFTLIIFLVTYSCTIVVYGVSSDYKKVKAAKPEIFIPSKETKSLCTYAYTDSSRVLVGHAKHIKDCLANNPRTLVYHWHPRCESAGCYLLSALQDYCDENNYVLYVYAQYYHYNMSDERGLRYPMLVIDTEYYKSDKVRLYTKQFKEDLIGKVLHQYGRIYYFQRDRFVGQYEKLEDLPT